MLLRNLMEDKQLNLDQPLLSVRRHSPTIPTQKRENRRIDSYSHQLTLKPPTYISELKSGPIRDPGAVPFIWEHSPGQPKEDTKPQSKNSAVTPKLPPGRPDVCKKQGVEESCTSESKKQDGDVFREFRTFLSEDRVEEEEEEGCDSGDEAYIDALDTLSRTESSFLNCSASGLSGLGDVDVKSSQVREFVMMDRFLPAAKAMASETPKKEAVQVQTQQVKNTSEKNKHSLRYGTSFANKYAYYNNEEDEIDEEEDQEAYLPSVCGLLPRFCLKSSLCLLSPVNETSVDREPPYGNKTRSIFSSSCSYNEVDKMQIGKANLRSECDAALPFLEQKEFLLAHGENRQTGVEGFQPNNGLKTFGEFLEDRLSPDGSDSEDPILEKKRLYAEGVSRLLEEEDAAKARKEEDFKKFHNPKDNSRANQFSLLAPPPLPNSPSDSWLCRTLPSMAPKSLPLRLFHENHSAESEMKWESKVKGTKVQRHNMRHSEESFTEIPES